MVNKFRIKLSIGKIVAYGASGSLVILSLIFAFIVFQPVDVIKDWTLKTTATTYTAGDEVTVISKLVKTMNVPGTSSRYVTCVNSSGTEERFDINSAQANRPAGSRSTEVILTLPEQITNLPRQCHITINIVYKLYKGIRTHVESADSNNFTVNPKTNSDAVALQESVPIDNSPIEPVSNAVQPITQQPATATQNPVTTLPSDDQKPEPFTILGLPICVPLVNICVEQ